MTAIPLQAPFPYFGGKSTVADVVWSRFGDVPNYVEPFFGSGAVLLRRPFEMTGQLETVNDLDGMISNFWRAVKHDPERVAEWADWPVNENDLHARHYWLKQRKPNLRGLLEGDPDYYDAKIAGWWCWGMCCWIGHGFCSADGPWVVQDSKLVHLGNKGQGIKRQRVHLGNKGRGINRKRVGIYAWFDALSERLKRVRVCCGDWSRVCGPTPTVKQGLTGVFLDPPYASADRNPELYAEESLTVAHAVREWAMKWGDDPSMRIALCGYDGEHDMPDTWECYEWKTNGGYGSQGSQGSQNAHKERIWFSPHCLAGDEMLWDGFDEEVTQNNG